MASNAMHSVGDPLANHTKSIFGTDGVRGKVGRDLTPSLILQLGYWCGHVLQQEGPIILGKDSRASGAMFTAALTAGLTAAGKEVWQIGLCPTPVVPLLIKKTGAAGGLMVSASHNPPDDNGIKVFGGDGAKISSEEQLQIESGLQDSLKNSNVIPTSKACGQSYQRNELLDIYKKEVIKSVNNKRLDGVPIVLDLCWGSATACGAELFDTLGANITVLHGHPNGKLINVNCGSTQLAPLKQAVQELGAEMGFAFDGDSDRMLAVDGKGRVLDGDHVLYLWGASLQERNELPEDRLVATVMSNLGFEKAWKERGGLLERTPVGDQFVHAKMIETGAALGGEQSGHILCKEHGLSGDGLLSALQLATICQSQNLSLSEWRDQSFSSFPQKLVSVRARNLVIPHKWQESTPIKEAVMKAEEAMGEEGRVLLRESGTEPLLRVMVEAEDPRLVESWTSHLASILEECLEAA